MERFKMKKSKFNRFIAGCSALAILVSTIPSAKYNSVFTSFAEDIAGEEQSEETSNEFLVFSPATQFNLNGGSIDNAYFTVNEGICTLADGAAPAYIPDPSAPVNSNLVFAGWVDSNGNGVTEFQENTTYYANWSYGSAGETNSISGLQYLIYRDSKFFDLRGSGGFKTTYGNGGYDLIYKYKTSENSANINGSISSFNGSNATYSIGNNIYITPVLSFSDSKGRISGNEQENAFLKVDYIIQNRGEYEVTDLGISSTSDIMIGGNDRASIFGYSADQTPVTAENKALFSTVPNIEMHDGYGNIFSLSLSDNGNCWWGHYSSRNTNAFSGHLKSDYSTGYDSGIAYSWQDISLLPGQTISKNAVFAAGDIHLFRKHSYDINGYCFGGGDCELAIDHVDENTFFCQPPICVNNIYEIRNSGQLMWLSEHINDGTIANNVSVKLMCDIVFPEDSRIIWKPFKNYSGTFDGCGFNISGIKYVSENAEESGGIFGSLSGARISNLGIKDSEFESENGNTASVAGNADASTIIKNVYSFAEIKGSKAAGLVYSVEGSSSLLNSFYAGNSDNDNKVYGSNSGGTVENCYYLYDQSVYTDEGAYNIPADGFASGMIAYKLGENWYQNIITDSYPTLRGESRVYSYTKNHACDEANPLPEIIYTNDQTQSGKIIPVEHEYEWGSLVIDATCTENEFWNKKCVKCGKVTSETFERVEEGHLALGHTYDWGSVVFPNTCTENAVWSKKCIRCGEELGDTYERTDGNNAAKGHRYDWKCMITPPTCTENAVWSKHCLNCGDVLEETFERTDGENAATGHNYDWYEMITPSTCTENAVWSKHCLNCGDVLEETFERTDGENAAKGHNYDWYEMITPSTCTENAVWSKHCLNCGDVPEETFERTDGENAATGHDYEWYRMVVPADCLNNSLWTKKCSKCSHQTADTFERTGSGYSATGHSYGDDRHCTKCGKLDPSAVVTTAAVTSSSGSTGTTPKVTGITTSVSEPTAPVVTTKEPYARVPSVNDDNLSSEIEKTENKKLNITGDMSVTPMTKDDIAAAGISLSDPSNYHCYNYSIEMDFEEVPIIFTKYEAVPVSYSSAPAQKKIVITPPEKKSDPVVVPQGDYTYVPSIGASVGYFEYEEQEMFIIIYGESKWLKEFYDVQLVLFNSDTEPLTNCIATLDVPYGLTLCNSSQTKYIGDLNSGGVSDIHWYLRGDEAGDYSLSAKVTGENDGDVFSYDFHSRNNLHVYAGNALKMTIEAPNYSCFGDAFKMKISLKNVSDKPIYNLENNIKNIDHGYYYTKTVWDDGTVTKTSGKNTLLSGGSTNIAVDELLPGQSAVVELSITDMWKGPLQKQYEEAGLFFSALKLGLGKMPVAYFCASLASSIVDGVTVVHVLDNFVVTTLEGSTTEIPYEVITTDYTDEFIDDHAFDLADAVVDATIGSFAPSDVKQYYYMGKYYTKKFDFIYDLVGNMEKDAQKVSDGTLSLEEFQRMYCTEYLKACSVLPINLDQVKTYLSAIGKGSIEVNWKGQDRKIPVTGLITVGQDVMKLFEKPDGKVTADIYITDKDGNKIDVNSSQVQNISPLNNVKSFTNTVLSRSLFAPIAYTDSAPSQEPAYELNIVDGDYEYNNGVYTLESDALIQIKANRPEEQATVHLVYSDGHTAEYPLLSIPEHECKGGSYHVVAAPDSANYGVAVQYCETCGKIMDTKLIATVCKAMLSNGEIFQNVYDAVRFAEESNEELDLSIFGNITLDKDLVIPENVNLLVTPFAYVTFTNSAKIISENEVVDYTGSLENVYENIVLNYWDGRTETISVEYGTEVSELPVLSAQCGFGGWYSDSELTTPFEPFTAGEEGHSSVYYADINHTFNKNGKCTVCGELKNGYDAFLRAGVSVGDNINLKLTAEISDKAAADTNAHIVFEFPDGAKQTQKISNAIINGDGTYTFSCKVPINNISDVIKAQMYYSDNVKGSYLEYSVNQYTDYIIENESRFDNSVVNSIKSLVNFSGYVQIYSGYDEENAINKSLNMPLDNTDVVIGNEYKAVKEVSGNSISVKSAGLSISEQASIRIKFSLNDGEDINNYKFTVDGKIVSPVKSGNYYVVSVNGVSPDNYDKMYLFKAESKNNPLNYASVKYSGFTYIKSILENDFDSKLTNTMKAMYFYNREIEKYISKTE